MSRELTKCPRCGRFFTKMTSSVCCNCIADEDRDYQQIRDVLQDSPGSSIEDVSKESGVDIETVMRMLDDGRIVSTKFSTGVTCGRCGAPAISLTQRLCYACLGKMDRECLLAMRDLQAKIDKRMQGAQKHGMNNVRETLDEKREGPKPPSQRAKEEQLAAIGKMRDKVKTELMDKEVNKLRMVVQERIQRGKR